MNKLTNDQWNRIVQALVTFIVTVCNVILVSSCALSISGSLLKNSPHSSATTNQRVEQVVDSTTVNNPLNFQK